MIQVRGSKVKSLKSNGWKTHLVPVENLAPLEYARLCINGIVRRRDTLVVTANCTKEDEACSRINHRRRIIAEGTVWIERPQQDSAGSIVGIQQPIHSGNVDDTVGINRRVFQAYGSRSRPFRLKTGYIARSESIFV